MLPIVGPSGHSCGFSLVMSDVSLAVGGFYSLSLIFLPHFE